MTAPDAHEYALAFAERNPHVLAACRAAYEHGRRHGWQAGYLAAEQATADAWRPVAERVRRDAGRLAWEQLLVGRGEYEVAPGQYRALPRKDAYTGGAVEWGEGTDA